MFGEAEAPPEAPLGIDCSLREASGRSPGGVKSTLFGFFRTCFLDASFGIIFGSVFRKFFASFVALFWLPFGIVLAVVFLKPAS